MTYYYKMAERVIDIDDIDGQGYIIDEQGYIDDGHRKYFDYQNWTYMQDDMHDDIFNGHFADRLVGCDNKIFDAIENDNVSGVMKLLNNNILNIRCVNGVSLLHYAIYFNSLQCVKYLIKSRIDINCINDQGIAPLHVAAYFGYLNIVRILIKRGCKINCVDNYNLTPLYFASKMNHFNVVKCLINNGANKDIQSTFCMSPFAIAARKNNAHIVKLFLKIGVDIDERFIGSETALIIAAHSNNFETVKVLVGSGADLSISEYRSYANTALYRASLLGFEDIVEYLIMSGAVVEVIGKNNILCNVIQPINLEDDEYPEMYVDIAKMLVKYGADINSLCDKNHCEGENALHLAAERGLLDLVKFLINNDADLYIKNIDGKTAYELAFEEGYHDVAEYIKNSEPPTKGVQ